MRTRRRSPIHARPPLAVRPTTDAMRAMVHDRVEQIVQQFALSPREREVFEMLLYGSTADEIASKLGVSTRTVKFHQTNVLQKLDADSRLDLFRLFFSAE
jgi:two-component system, NarL family, response regulator FusR